MVAMAILAMSLTAGFEVVGGALRNHVRARQLEVATLLARERLVEALATFEEEGFRDFDQTEDGTFEEQGHPEVRWTVEAVKPDVELGADGVIRALTGADGGLTGLLGLGPREGEGAAPLLQAAGPALAAIDAQLIRLGEEIKRGVREVRLTVSWPDGARTESFTVVTHLVVLVPGNQRPDPAAAPAVLPQGVISDVLEGGGPLQTRRRRRDATEAQ
jgi:general secretion pathway protein I